MSEDERSFTCDLCGRTFPKERPDADALAEAEARGETMDDLAVVCDDCFKAIHPTTKQ